MRHYSEMTAATTTPLSEELRAATLAGALRGQRDTRLKLESLIANGNTQGAAFRDAVTLLAHFNGLILENR